MTVPNILTLLRLLALPVILLMFRSGRGLAAAAVFVVAMLTDCADGWLARKSGQRSVLGLYFDAVVDKIVILVLLYELAMAGMMSPVAAHLFLARELLQSAVRSAGASRQRVIGANWMGKTKAFLQVVLVTCGLALSAIVAGQGLDKRVPLIVFETAVWGVLAVTWCFFGVFVFQNRALLLERPDSSGRR